MKGTGPKCAEAVFWWIGQVRQLKDALPPDTKKKIYNTMVLPHLDYCSIEWQERMKYLRKNLERVEN